MREIEPVLKPPLVKEALACNKALREILFLAEASTRKKVMFGEWDMLPQGLYKFPRPEDKFHRIFYSSGQNPESFVHTLAHELGHLIRLWYSPEKFRMSYVINYYRAQLDIGHELPKFFEDEWFHAQVGLIVKEVIDFPSDFYVDGWLWKQYPGLRECLTVSMEEEVRKIDGLNLPERNLAQKKVVRTEFLMSCARKKYHAQLMGRPLLVGKFSEPLNSQAERLIRLFHSIPDRGLKSNIELTNAWAEQLEIKDWFEWVPFGEEKNL